MNDVQTVARYGPGIDNAIGERAGMYREHEGDWVRYADYASLAKRVRELEDEVGYLRMMLGAASNCVESNLPFLAGYELEQSKAFREDIAEALASTEDAAMQDGAQANPAS